MKIDVIGAKDNLVEKAGEILLSAGSLADNLVIFPGKRPAHFLRKFLAEKKGSALKAPVITSMDGFIDLAAEELWIVAPSVSPLDLAGVLYGGLRKEFCHVIARDPGLLSLDLFLPWAFKLIGDFEELKIELKTQKDLSGYDAILPADLKSVSFIKKLESFSRLYGEFYAACEKENLVTRSMKYAKVAAEIGRFGHKRYENIIFAGFFALTNAEKAILKHLAAHGARVILESGPGLKEQFAFLGELPSASNPEPSVSLHFYKAGDIHGEIFKLAQVLKAPAPGDLIVLPEARSLFPVIENVLPGVKDYNISMGYPLVSTPVYALIDALADLLDKKGEGGYFAANYLKFVFHPYVKNIYLGKSAESGRVVFQTVEENISSRVNKYVELKEIENNEEILENAAAKLKDYGRKELDASAVRAHIILIHKTLIVPFEDIKDIGDFAAKLLALISYISENSTAPLHPYWAPFVERAIEHIIELRNSRLAAERFDAPAGYFKFFKTFIRSANYPFPGTPLKGLQVLGLLETRNLKFDRVYFLDANADILPSSRKEDTILPHFVRESLGLATYKTREQLARYYFNVLISGAKEAHIFYKDSAAKERSPFVEKLIWDLERRNKKPEEADVHFRIRFSQNEPAPVAKTPEVLAFLKKREFSPSAIDTYLNCGLRFYYKYALRLSEKDEISDEIEQREIGTIVHEILENFFKSRVGKPLHIKEADYIHILEDAAKVFDSRLRGHNAGCEYLIKRQVEKRLADILDYHRDNLAGITILDCEKEFKAYLPTKYGRITLKGRADRVDQRDNRVHILDYKTGALARVPNWTRFDFGLREDWPKTLKSTQLPFYIMAYMGENTGADIRNMDASLMLLGREKIVEESLFKERYKKTPDKSAIFGVYRQTISALIEEILDENLPFVPVPDEAACANCPFKILCGRQWVE